MEVAPPPEPVAPRPRKRCPHDYCDKWHCPMCNPCPGGHGKIKANGGICNGTVLEQDAATLEQEAKRRNAQAEDSTWIRQMLLNPRQFAPVPAGPGEKCTHTYYRADNKLRTYSTKAACPVCSNCGHKTTKKNCKICSDCGHGTVKQLCKVCYPCPHGLLRLNCRGNAHAKLPVVVDR